MALHERLSLWQRILLGIFCFPLLPFYLCVYCLCLKEDDKEVDQEEGQRDGIHVEKDANAGLKRKTQEDSEEDFARHSKGKATKFAVTNEGFQDDEKGKEWKEGLKEDDKEVDPEEGQRDGTGQRGNTRDIPKAKKNNLSFNNKVHVEKDANAGLKRKTQEDSEEDFARHSKGKATKFAVTNEGFQDDEKGKEWKEVEVHKDENAYKKTKKQKDTYGPTFKYPWDRQNLKSLELDLKAFKKLDAYASKVDSRGSVETLVKELLRDSSTDLEKTRAIWIWTCTHIEYDVAGYSNTALRSSDPDDIFRTRKGVCAGYASIFQKMCTIAGVQCITVSGYAKGISYTIGQTIPGKSNHAWNMVYLQGGWHLLDSTWGAGHADSKVSKFTFEYTEFYFLTHPALFIEDHFPDQADFQLLDQKLSQQKFGMIMRRRGHFYNLGLLYSHPDTAVIKTVKGKVSITIESSRHMLFTFNLNETEKPGLMRFTEFGATLEVYPQKTGQHILDIYSKSPDSEGAYPNVLTYKVDCNEVDTSMKIPKCLQSPTGPSWLSEQAGLLDPSHRDPVINTHDGCFTISFAVEHDLRLFCTLDSDDIKMTSEMEHKHIFQTRSRGRVQFMVHLPQPGTYVLNVHVKEKGCESYTTKCSYLVICRNPAVQWPVFPLAYKKWAEHYELVEPLKGILPKNSNVFFHLKVPGVTALFVEARDSFPLTLNDQGYWEGTCSTADCKELYVAVSYKKQPNTREYILRYEVQ
ncbi:kyphoscoliosis peptidase-like [Spea bombifrons]|uniref:kyphoscoliosis peptidase-like n=1 Tax=Spea bombifrons TaxID=233779 RepID=UPI00234A2BD1|nr:kyphoscoliosis peptidase-like [Spea bombifrons]